MVPPGRTIGLGIGTEAENSTGTNGKRCGTNVTASGSLNIMPRRMAESPVMKDDIWTTCTIDWLGIVTISDTTRTVDTIAGKGAGITTYTGGQHTTVTRNTVLMDIITPNMTGIVFPALGYSRADSFPYPSAEIEIDFKRKLIDTSKVRN